ncbi:MAG: hypothetical protein WBX25_35450 [Rhodomicrobium sp.]
MRANSGVDFARRAVKWFFASVQRVNRFLNKQRDTRLKKYRCSIQWVDGDEPLRVIVEVRAESEDQARQLAHATAIKKLPVVTVFVSGRTFTPPYIRDAKAAFAQWNVVVMPLSDLEHEQVASGEFGPARALDPGVG